MFMYLLETANIIFLSFIWFKLLSFEHGNDHNVLVAMHHSLYVTSFWSVAISHKSEIIASMLIT